MTQVRSPRAPLPKSFFLRCGFLSVSLGSGNEPPLADDPPSRKWVSSNRARPSQGLAAGLWAASSARSRQWTTLLPAVAAPSRALGSTAASSLLNWLVERGGQSVEGPAWSPHASLLPALCRPQAPKSQRAGHELGVGLRGWGAPGTSQPFLPMILSWAASDELSALQGLPWWLSW